MIAPAQGTGGGSAPANMVVNDADNTLAEGVDFTVGTATGTKIGTGATEKLGFFGHTPVVQPASVTPPAGGVTQDAECRVAVTALIARLGSGGSGLGLTA